MAQPKPIPDRKPFDKPPKPPPPPKDGERKS